MKYKAQIIAIVLLAAVFGAMFGVWQFYYKEIFDGYKQDERLREALESTLRELQEDFQGYKPELLIEEWQNKIQPWKNARDERSRYFNFGGWYDVDLTPPEARILKFWYTEETNKILYDVYTKVYQKLGAYDRFPGDLREIMRAAKEDDWAGRNVDWNEVKYNLELLTFGVNLTNMILDANVTSVKEVSVWPRRIPENFAELLALQTIGLHFTITTRDLVKLMEKLSQESRFFTVDALKVSYPYIAYAVEPQLEVQMLLTQANYRPPAEPQDAPAMVASEAGPGAQPEISSRRRQGDDYQETFGQRAWRWFRQTILYMP